MATTTLRRIEPLSAGKVVAMVDGFIGLIAGIIFALFALMGMSIGAMAQSENSGMPAFFGAFFGVGAVIILPLLYACMGFIVGLISAAIYNLVAGWVGGIQVELA
jgi:Transmembrane domain of unknown function (DUF3566)